MKLKRFITLLLISFYLFAVVGQIFSALACSCIEFRIETPQQYSCCSSCSDHNRDSKATSIKNMCCSDTHSTDVELYTSNNDNNKQLRKVLFIDNNVAITTHVYNDRSDTIPSDSTQLSECQIIISDSPPMVGICFRAPPVLA